MAIIDSLFHNYYVPPVIFAIAKDPIDGVETRLCVDGKQRLRGIQNRVVQDIRQTHQEWAVNDMRSIGSNEE
jgi:hypothetical protein